MRVTFLVIALGIAGCAGQPSSPATAPSSTRYVTATGQAQATVAEGDIDAKKLADAKKQGYTLVNADGQQLFCRSDFKTGSRVQRNTTCLTAEELDIMHDQTKSAMRNNFQQNAPPSGK
jgi:hypothetical protein